MKIIIISLLSCYMIFYSCSPKESSLPKVENIVTFEADSISPYAHFKDFKVSRKDFEDMITTYHQISEDHWLHGYHHIGMNDITGIIILKDGTEIKWMVRPGGLATMTYPDGRVIFLAKELSSRSD